MLRTFLFSSFLLTIAYLTYTSLPVFSFPTTPYKNDKYMSSSHSQHASWLAQCTPHPNPHAYTPTFSALRLAVLRNAPVEHEGFTLALFQHDPKDKEYSGDNVERVAITTTGRVLLVPKPTFDALLALSAQAVGLPDTGTFRNTWVVKQDRTSQPIDRLFVVSPPGEDSSEKEISVQGFDGTNRELKVKTAGFDVLPEVLWELFGLVLEGRDGSPGDGDAVVLGKVREVVGKWF